jgi:polysaccharide pyruvyl transferase WcaK-like protein
MRSGATFATPDVRTVLAEVAGCEAVVAMRYHAAVAAVLGGRPAVLLGYSPKVPALAADVPGGLAGLAWDHRAPGALPAALAGVLGRGAEVIAGRERLRRREQANDTVLDRLLEEAARRR